MENKFDTNRLINFIKRQSALNIPSLAISTGAVFGFMLLVSEMVASFYPEHISALIPMYLFAFYLSGMIFSSRIFAELHNPQKGYAYLTLPASTFEKFLGSWLLSSPIYTVMFSLLCVLLYFLACTTGGRMEDFSMISSLHVWKRIASFLVIQSVFFLGAIYFRKNNFMKTVFALFVIMVAITLYGKLISLLLWGNMTPERLQHMETNINFDDIENLKEFVTVWIRDFAYYTLLGPFMLLVSYYRLKERQIN